MSTKKDKKVALLLGKDSIVKREKKNKKMKPFSKGGQGKWVLNDSSEMQRSMRKKNKKLEAKNANRSLKKGVRQEQDKDLKKQIDEFYRK